MVRYMSGENRKVRSKRSLFLSKVKLKIRFAVTHEPLSLHGCDANSDKMHDEAPLTKLTRPCAVCAYVHQPGTPSLKGREALVSSEQVPQRRPHDTMCRSLYQIMLR